ncbi:hypothetical protein BCR32DRAFT_277858 [Anaeromyces robustus]|uniref:Uncharacterized protein n=1 Tax=Anaeromyces robustus TaxID=1754192 RepID=A0A1Y1XD58_9FUNG|nr:hypothetical protein BCR32DRAFT_277858 [Anaeromyces robustus]|eukprot:ORX83612.1 hypothetical protein BCR32DRAFT_277858 [Anaeromyces robustus]
MASQVSNNISITINGLISYKTYGKKLVDIKFSLTSMRTMNERKMFAVKWLFYAEDCRSGAAERKIFHICLDYLSKKHQEIAKDVIKFIPILVVRMIYWNIKGIRDGKISVSVCAEWMLSINASAKKTKELACIFIKKFNCSEKQY